MTDQLIKRLRNLGSDKNAIGRTCTESADMIEFLTVERDRCHARLEIDHVFIWNKSMSDDAEPVRVTVPLDKRASKVDAVSCRDATIGLLEDHIAEMKVERDALRAALIELCAWIKNDMGADLPSDLADAALEQTESE